MYPHERSLVKKLEGKPFALIGVNSDTRRETAKKATISEKLTWRSFWNGRRHQRAHFQRMAACTAGRRSR